jgi:hypothetical protein
MNSKNIISKIWSFLPYRILFLIFVSLIILWIAVLIFADSILNNITQGKILPAINKSPDTHVEINKLHYNLFSNSVNLVNCQLSLVDSSSSNSSKYLVAIPSVRLSGINWFRLLFGNGISFSSLIINKPEINISSESKPGYENKSSKDTSEKTLLNYSFISNLPKRIRPLYINKFSINSGKIIDETADSSGIVDLSIKNFSFTIKEIRLDTEIADDSLNLIFVNDIILKASNIERREKSSATKLTIDSIYISSIDSSLNIKNLSFKPYVSLDNYFSRKKYRSDRYIISIPSLNLAGINLRNLFWKKIIYVKKISTNDFLVDIITDKRLPINPSCCPKMPNEILRNLDVKLNIRKISLSNGKLFIKSLQDWSKSPAVLSFINVDTKINNLCSVPEKKDTCIIAASANIQNRGRLTLNLRYPLISSMLNFSYKGYLDSMSALPLNNWLEVENLVRVSSGMIDRISFSADVEDGITKISEKPLYHDLAVKKLSKTSKGEEIISSFIFNTFVLRKSNPNDKETKIADIFYAKKNEDAFLDVLWVPIRTALGKVVGF